MVIIITSCKYLKGWDQASDKTHFLQHSLYFIIYKYLHYFKFLKHHKREE